MFHTILVVDDDAKHRALIAAYLQKHDYEIIFAANSLDIQKQRQRYICHLIILDINMAGEDGLSICKRLRDEGDNTPILFLSANNETVDKVLGLEYGADDYMSKPFDPRELLARIRSLLRRIPEARTDAYDGIAARYQFGYYVLDGQTRSLSYKNNPVTISSEEYALLITLINALGKPLSRTQLAHQISTKELESNSDCRFIDTMVSRLRKRLEPEPNIPQYLLTIRGVGYAFTTQITQSSSL